MKNLEHFDDSLKQSLPAGTVLLKQGTRSGKLFILLDGTIEVKREETLVATIDEPGAMFGEMSALLDIDHTANVVAATPVTVYHFADAAGFLQSDPADRPPRRAQAGATAEHRHDLSRGLKRQYSGHSNHLGWSARCWPASFISRLRSSRRDLTGIPVHEPLRRHPEPRQGTGDGIPEQHRLYSGG
jgi:CRP/FNR family transcriptional regulator, cyclic AMP receptor protein